MKAFALLLTCLAVIITIRQPPQMIICPQPPSLFVKAEDGSYIQNGTTMTTLQSCWGKATSWQEEWTDYPEKGGKFIRRVEPK
uniref:Uncharacterized protein n=1 Tax=viral metagenome TaxID=1070528 RepID=A0A6M3M3I3_9ZZZZ